MQNSTRQENVQLKKLLDNIVCMIKWIEFFMERSNKGIPFLDIPIKRDKG